VSKVPLYLAHKKQSPPRTLRFRRLKEWFRRLEGKVQEVEIEPTRESSQERRTLRYSDYRGTSPMRKRPSPQDPLGTLGMVLR